jgi:hypothetical protein
MNFHKYELHTLKYLSFYKKFAIVVMAVGFFFVLFGVCVILFKKQAGGALLLNNALTAAAVIVLCCGYLMLHYIKIIEKFKKKYQIDNKKSLT